MAARQRKFILIFLLGIVGVALCAVMATGGFVAGRLTSPDPTAGIRVDASAENVESAGTGSVEVESSDGANSADGEALSNQVEAATQERTPTVEDTETAQTATATPRATVAPDAESTSGARESDFSEEDLEILWEVWNHVEAEFDGDLPEDRELTYAAIRGLLDTLDDEFTRFAPPDVAERMREDLQGSFEGIGAFVRENDEGLTEIVRPMDGQPADLAGLRAGDVVVGVDGESVVGMSLDEVIALIRGPEGSEVELEIRREEREQPFEVTIVRERIDIPVIQSEMLEEGIAYVRLTSFNRNAEPQLREALNQLLSESPRGLVLDLRDNPGGFLDQSIAVADLFLNNGVVLFERSETLDIQETYRSDNGDLAEEIPLVVLINAGSASASEIVAGAIQDRSRGVLIGETTFGKGSVQQSHTLSDGSELRVTIARWYTPDNTSIDGDGIPPDIEVETPEDLGGEEDVQLQRAIDYLSSTE